MDRICVLCGENSMYLVDGDDLKQHIGEDGLFDSCFYGDAWELCKMPHKNAAMIPSQVHPLTNKEGDFMGVLRPLY